MFAHDIDCSFLGFLSASHFISHHSIATDSRIATTRCSGVRHILESMERQYISRMDKAGGWYLSNKCNAGITQSKVDALDTL